MIKTKKEDLYILFDKVREGISAQTGLQTSHGRNPKGDISTGFDLIAEQIVFKFCSESLSHSINIISEESGESIVGQDIPIETWIVDPVDGSENCKRNLGASGFSVAVSPYRSGIISENVKIGLMGNFASGSVIIGERGKGAFDSLGNKISVSKVTRLKDALIGCDLNFKDKGFDNRILKLISLSKDIRRMGSTVCELMFLAAGGYDGYVDVRGQLTAEDFLAASCIIREAGGIISDIDGEDWGDIVNLTTPKTIIAAATYELHKELLNIFR